jgi:hypothetical protein
VSGADSGKCRRLLADHEDDAKLADLIEAQHPRCVCESHSIGIGSPAVVSNAETVHRLIVSPRDYDPSDGTIRATPFEKVFKNGFSVWRALGPDHDVETLLSEGLSRSAGDPPKEIFAVCEAEVAAVRGMIDANGERLFCVYDQTVHRLNPTDSSVSTHASIFLRVPPPRTPERTRLRKDYAGQLRETFLQRTIAAASYKNGLCIRLNGRAAAGDFTR